MKITTMKEATKDHLITGLFILFSLAMFAGVILSLFQVITPEVGAVFIAGSFIITLGVMVFTFK